jgi:predicted DNA-binding ribbon-helix-helix protein
MKTTPKTTPPTTARGVRMPTSTWQAIRKIATDRGISLGAVIREIVNDRLDAQLTQQN